MKKILYSLLLGGTLMTTSCSDFTEIEPKGMNLLTTTTQLEMLLNNEFYNGVSDYHSITGDMITSLQHIPTLINQPTKTRAGIMISWDEAAMDKMAELTASDTHYAEYYGIIGTICNPILSKIDAAEGDEKTKNQLKCEALTLRAYYHYLLVNKFAKAYNPSTASSDNGIIYMTEDVDIMTPASPSTVEEVYTKILEDVDLAIELDGLPNSAVNRMRMSKPCAYAVKALTLISMQKHNEAAAVAKQVLAMNSEVNNYNEMTTIMNGYVLGGQYPVIYRPKLECGEDLFYSHYIEFFNAITPECEARFEPGHASLTKMGTDKMIYDYLMGMGSSYLGLDYPLTYDLESGWNMQGIKTTHMYLIVAEAAIESGDYDAAMEALDAIRVNRIDPAMYAPLKGTVTDKTTAILHLKQTSHGENIYSLYNFLNRKRWNQMDDYKETFTRDIAGQVFTLTPESPLWIFPLPQNAINNNPNLIQNYK